jgi:hypothetical protein
VKVYVDNNIVGALVKRDLALDQVEALARVLEAGQDRHFDLVTSQVAAEEISQIPEEHRHPHEIIYRLLARVPTAGEVRADSGLLLGMGVGGGSRPDPLLVKLRKLLDENDARHVFQAIKSGADVFLTADGGIIHRRKELLELGIKSLKPTELTPGPND